MKLRHYLATIGSILVGALLACIFSFPAIAGKCSAPPFMFAGAGSNTKTNVLFILDTSGSMGEFAYKGTNATMTIGTGFAAGTVSVSKTGMCDNLPNQCGTPCNCCRNCVKCPYCNQSKCNAASQSGATPIPATNPDTYYCADSVPWTITNTVSGDVSSGTCDWIYRCSWNGSACARAAYSGYPKCTKTAGNDIPTWSWNADKSTATGTITIANEDSGNYNAYVGFDPTSEYYGIYDSRKLYKYDNTKHYFYTQTGWDAYSKSGGPPIHGVPATAAGCPATKPTCSTDDADKFSGNFLNWLTTRRIDTTKKIMTGGRLGGDQDDWVIVGTAYTNDMSDDYNRNTHKLFNDNGSNGNYYTPFRQGVGAVFSLYDTDQRNTYVTGGNSEGKYVPLFVFLGVTFSSATVASTGTPVTLLAKDRADGNSGEPQNGNHRDWPAMYYMAAKYGPASGDPPTSVIQRFSQQMRLGYMRFNSGNGPCVSTYNRQDSCSTVSVDGLTTDYIICNADGARVENRIGDVSTTASRQKKASTDTDFIQIPSIVMKINETFARGNTPLAEVLREAWHYLRQITPAYSNAVKDPSTGVVTVQPDFLIGRTQTTDELKQWDPFYYQTGNPPTFDYQPCTDTYIIFLSDGEPTNDVPTCSYKDPATLITGTYTDVAAQINTGESANITDPANTSHSSTGTPPRFNGSGYLDDIAYLMHTYDMRPYPGDSGNLVGTVDNRVKQTATLVGIFAFNTDATDKDNLQRAALQGGFTDQAFGALSQDSQPGWSDSANPKTPGGTTITNWKYAYPCPSGVTTNCAANNYDGYKEWDPLATGSPSNFFSSDKQEAFGQEMENFIVTVLTSLAKTGSAAAVATVSQETSESDIIVRGAFTGADPNQTSVGLWQGHLEAYWPCSPGDTQENNYEFEFPGAVSGGAPLFCSEIPATLCDKGITSGAAKCWDAGFLLSDKSTDLADEELFTVTEQDISGVRTKVKTNITEANLNDVGSPAAPSPLRKLMRYHDDDTEAAGLWTVNEAKAIVQWLRGGTKIDANGQPILASSTGYDYKNRKVPNTTNRFSRLSDIVYSTPVVVGPPSLGSASRRDPNYTDFLAYRAAQRNRAKIVYVGANDGMIHAVFMGKCTAINGTTGVCTQWDYNYAGDGDDWRSQTDEYPKSGTQIWAYAPSNLVGEISNLCKNNYGNSSGGCIHRTMVDLAPKAYDVFIQSPSCPGGGRCWRTVIIGGERGGGDVYFAIDVTDPKSPTVLWEHSALNNLVVPVPSGTADEYNLTLPYHRRNPAANGDYVDDPVYFWNKWLPMTWSEPAVGRVKFPTLDNDSNFGFWRYAEDTTAPRNPPVLGKKTFTSSDNMRHVAFIGSGFKVFDTTVVDAHPPNPDGAPVRRALQKPYILALDIETGENYFQVLWPLIAKARETGSKLPEQSITIDATTTKIPWAMNTPVVVDVWDDNTNRFGEDGFVDQLYVGDMRGYLYKVRFNFKDYGGTSENNANVKGLDINFWKTKVVPSNVNADPITDPTDETVNCDETNLYRGCRQPITVAPAVSLDSTTVETDHPSLRILFGAGKFDDVTPGGYDDLTDLKKMTFYNAEDPVTAAPQTAMNALGNTFTVTPRTGAAITNWTLFDKAAASASDLSAGFKMAGCNMAVNYESGFCGDVGDNHDNDYKATTCTTTDGVTTCTAGTAAFNCSASNPTDCSDPQKEQICGSITDAAEQAACRANCKIITRTGCCNWVLGCAKNDTDCPKGSKPDCCEASCDKARSTPAYPPCWSCAFDLAGEGERIIGKAVVAAKQVFFTSYIPSKDVTTTGGCSSQSAAAGAGYLYILDYRCQSFESNPAPGLTTGASGMVTSGSTGTTPGLFGMQVSLGAGMPSQPVLDSKGENVIVQLSNAKLVRTPVETGISTNARFMGWRER